VDWDAWVADYATIRDAIGATYPDIFHDFNARMWTPGGFRKPVGAGHRVWKTDSGKAQFTVPEGLAGARDLASRPATMRLFTVRSDGQFNTTIYSHDDRFRGVYGSRMVLFMGRADMAKRALAPGDTVTLRSATDDGIARQVAGLVPVPYDIPEGTIAGYFPECNPLIPLWHHAKESKVPAAKAIDVFVERTGSAA
jgi:anaerobic selenocysteine-containing dehydrogenase